MANKTMLGIAVVMAAAMLIQSCGYLEKDLEELRASYTVTFNKNNGDAGSTEASPQTRMVTPPATTLGTLPEAPTRAGYTFSGWNTQAGGGGTAFTASTTVSANITVYAKWGCTVTFNKNNGDAGSTEASPQTMAVTPPVTTLGTLPEAPTRAGYTFSGWNTQAGGGGTAFIASTTVTANITVYAQWTPIIGMVYIPGGSFDMGTATGGNSDERPVHRVTLSGFYLAKHQVTQAQWQAVMGTNPSYFSSNPASGETQGNRPVESVSWYNALVFCNKLSMAEGMSPAYRISGSTNPADWGAVPTSSNSTWNAAVIVSGATGYRLPTEAQWEYAAKGGNSSPGNYTYSGSNNAGEVAWYSDNSGNRTHEVGKKAANGLGLYDMSGNVYEWCWDWYGSYSSEAQEDPVGPSSGANRVVRGGGYYDSAEYLRSASRYFNYPIYRNSRFGFQLLRP